ncbi:MAG: hypothetical protein MUQ10_04770 [Anaerolineae bacterium]|nr:hypothetical protein [Anaerolineae bacterium]
MSLLSSKERLLSAIRYDDTDHVPLIFRTFGVNPPPDLAWSNQYEEAQAWLSLGTDAWLEVSLPQTFHPDVTVSEWEEVVPGERWPLMVKAYNTPAGVLRQEVYRTDDWVSPDWPMHKSGGGGIQLLDDYNVPRSRKHVVESEEDMQKLKYLLCPPSDEAIARFQESVAVVAQQADELGVPLVGSGPSGTDSVTWLCGVEGMVFMALDQPDAFSELLDIVQRRDVRVTEILLDTPVDMIVRRGFYEGTTFWSPALYREHFAPRIKELTAMVHQGDRLMTYIMSVGFLPLLDTLVEIGYDAHYLLDPIAGGSHIDLRRVKSTFDKKIAVIGGLNEPVTLEQGTREQIRQEVFDAVQHLGPGGGLILCVAEAVMASTPWKSIETVIEAWREVRDEPTH